MLKVLQIPYPQAKKPFLENLDPARETWLVSDLRTKFEIQQTLLARFQGFEDWSVFRASEMWRQLLKRYLPEYRLVSKDFLRAMVKEGLREHLEKTKRTLSLNSDDLVFEFMDLFASVYSHPNMEELLSAWFRENQQSEARWGAWFELGDIFFQKILAQKTIAASWTPGILANQVGSNLKLSRKIYVDLGSQLSRIEAELLGYLSQHTDVVVFEPMPDWADDFSHLLSPYKYLRSLKATVIEKVSAQTVKSQKVFERFSGPLAEMKESVGQVRSWIASGVAPEKIAVIAPEIERWWPMASVLFATEGIPVAKDEVTRLHALPSILAWIAKLKTATGQVTFSTLETSLYEPDLDSPLRFEEFFGLFSEMMGIEDLGRHEKIQKGFRASFQAEDRLSRDEFVGFALQFWNPQMKLQLVEGVFRELLDGSIADLRSDAKSDIQLQAGSWIYLLEQIVSKKEIRLKYGAQKGVELINLTAADSDELTHKIFIGLTESQLKDHRSKLIDPSDVLSLERELGFFLAHPEQSQKEFDLQWQSEREAVDARYFTSGTNMNGDIETPAAFWLKNSGNHSALKVPKDTVWDSELKHFDDSARKEQPEQRTLVKVERLSASALTDYLKCPFIYKAKRIFKLEDPAIIDLDIDQRSLGSFAHAVFEKLMIGELFKTISEKDIPQLLETVKIEKNLKFVDDVFWQAFKKRYIKIVSRFIEFERSWAKDFPENRVLGVEVPFETTIEGMTFTGKIDRLDGDGKTRAVVIDYKSGMTARSLNDRIENDRDFQMVLYALAIEQGGSLEIAAKEVVAAVYYYFQSLDREQGLRVTEKATGLVPIADRKRSNVSEEHKKDNFKNLATEIQTVTGKLKLGEFPPKPHDPVVCHDCEWRKLCRAPHLN